MLDIFRTLPGILKDVEETELVREAMVFAAWRRIAGAGLNDHTVPLKLEGATLAIAVSNITWQRHLKDLAGQMLFKINAALGTPVVNYLEFEIDEAAVLKARSRPLENDAELQREAEKEISPEIAEA